jgi:hypothetical protein
MSCPSLDDIAAFEADGSDSDEDTANHIRRCADCERRLLDLRRQRAAVVDLLASRPPERVPGCPDWESLAAYVERGPDAVDVWVTDHVERCEACLLQVAAFRMAREPASPKLRVLPRALPARVEKSAWLGGLGGKWWMTGSAGALAAAAMLTLIIVNRLPEYATVALSRPPADLLPKSPVLSPPPQPAHPSPGASGTRGVSPEQPQPEGPVLYRGLPKTEPPVSVIFHYSSGGASRQTPLPLPDGFTLHSGDRFSMQVATKSSMWLYVFQEDGEGAVSALFPSVSFETGANPVSSAAGRIIPAPGQAFELNETTGIEKIYVFYGPARVDRCERLLALVESHAVDSDVRKILREMVRAADTSDLSALGYAALRFPFRHEP